MAQAPTLDELTSVVRDIRITLLSMGETEAANDPDELSRRVREDRFLWKKGAGPAECKLALASVLAAEIPPYDPPKEIYPQEELFKEPIKTMSFDLIKKDFVESKQWKVEWRFHGIHHAQGGLGSKGCYFLNISPTSVLPGEVIGLKESDTARDFHLEVFSAIVFRLHGLVAPRFVPMSKEDFAEVVHVLRQVPVTHVGTCAALHEHPGTKTACWMEFIRGKTLPEFTAFDTLDWNKFGGELGSMMALDMLLNNFDRLPIVHLHEGNATNVMISPAHIVCIDQAYVCMTDKKLQDAYIDRIKACLREISAKQPEEGPYFKRLDGFLADNTCLGLPANVDLRKKITRACLDGLIYAATSLKSDQAVKTLFESAEKELHELYEASRVGPIPKIDPSLALRVSSEAFSVI